MFSSHLLAFTLLLAPARGLSQSLSNGDEPALSPPPGSLNVSLETEISVRYSTPIDGTSLETANLELRRISDGQLVPLEVSWIDSAVVLKPTIQFYTRNKYQEWEGVDWLGLRPNNRYRLTIRNLRDTDGRQLPPWDQTAFSTAELDFGLHWQDAGGRQQKHSSTIGPAYFDPARPTVIYLHGWQGDTSINDFRRENPFFLNSKYFEFQDDARLWKERGFNIGILYWSQWADEPEVRDAEAKIWKGRNEWRTRDGKLANMRFRTGSGSFTELAWEQSVTDVALRELTRALQDYSGPGLHLVGHSLGSQLAITLTQAACQAADAGTLPEAARPSRLTILDPFWSHGRKPYLGNETTGQRSARILSELARRGVSIDSYKSSPLGGLVGDQNLTARHHVAFLRLWPDFIRLTEPVYQHIYAYIWFFKSIVAPLPAEEGFLGAAATSEEVRRLMNRPGSPLRSWGTSGPGTQTQQPEDDELAVRDGVDSW